MATYVELDNLANDGDMLAKVRTALCKAATAFVDAWIADPAGVSDSEIVWARNVLREPRYDAQRALGIIVQDGGELTVEQVKAASEPLIQGRVDEVVPWLVAAQAAS